MSIVPLPVFEADADPHHRDARSDEEIYRDLEAPKSIVVRFGYLKLVGEYSYGGDAKPGCGTKLVARTHRGTEMVQMLTTTCDNSGCSKSVSRKELLKYIDNSGGKDYPFYTRGRILRVATVEDLNRQAEFNNRKPEYARACKELIEEYRLPMKLVEPEPILGGELLTFYYMSEQRVDFRDLVKGLASQFQSRIEMRQVGARDEARLVADYERCGQHCCCKNFLKVLSPVSMRAAKLQKATLDPLKISGRCGRLMCCLRYEDQTYRELKSNLPNRKCRVGTNEGAGIVIDSKVLVQLVLVRLEADGRDIAVPVEELMDPETCPKPEEVAARRAREADALRGLPPKEARRPADGKSDESPSRRGKSRRRRRRGKDKAPPPAGSRPESKRRDGDAPTAAAPPGGGPPAPKRDGDGGSGAPKRKRRRRSRRRRKGPGGGAPKGEGEA